MVEGNDDPQNKVGLGDKVVRRINYTESVKFGSVVGGNPTTPDRWKSHVMVHTYHELNDTHSGTYFCGGVLVSPSYVLTSVRCVEL